MTVSFFKKRSKTRAQGLRNAFTYAFSIVAIYVLLGFGVSKIIGIDALNSLSTKVWFNLIFFILLLIFAASFFGAFEITLPSSFVNKVDKQSGKGGPKTWKKNFAGKNRDEFEKDLHSWYAKDKTRTIQTEFLEIFNRLD